MVIVDNGSDKACEESNEKEKAENGVVCHGTEGD